MNLSSILSSSNASLRFPLDKVETADDYVMFTVYKYHPPYRKAKCLDETGGSIWGGRFADYDTTGLGGGDLDTSEFKKMILYMPEDVSVNATQKWNGKSVGAAETAALRAAANAVDKIPGVKTKEQAGELAKNLATPGPGMAKGFAKAGALKAAASVMSGIDANDIGVSGLTLGADPLVSGVVMLASQAGINLSGLIVRKEAKGHGTGAWLEGPLPPKGSVITVLEDVVTTGGSSLKAVEKLRTEGYLVNRVLAIVDREEGGAKAMSKADLNLNSLFFLKEIVERSKSL